MLQVGDRVFIGDGYDMEPMWLQGGQGYQGIIEAFLYFDSPSRPHTLVRLEAPLTLKGITGSLLLLSLRYADVVWEDWSIVHVVLCTDIPRSLEDVQDNQRFAWVESHGSLRKI